MDDLHTKTHYVQRSFCVFLVEGSKMAQHTVHGRGL